MVAEPQPPQDDDMEIDGGEQPLRDGAAQADQAAPRPAGILPGGDDGMEVERPRIIGPDGLPDPAHPIHAAIQGYLNRVEAREMEGQPIEQAVQGGIPEALRRLGFDLDEVRRQIAQDVREAGGFGALLARQHQQDRGR